ncbi:MAG TPA: GTPase RsgA, partial [Burkholderiaceae bacterium]|nr:GTPase RsgA [Burkholderiaceae bacterium]
MIANNTINTPDKSQKDQNIQDDISAMLAAASAQAAQNKDSVPADQQHCGLIAIVGKPNVGKSTLLNKIAPEAAQKTSEISDYSEKGTHTTTFAEMFRLNDKTFIIDTPGIKEFGLIDMSRVAQSNRAPGGG